MKNFMLLLSHFSYSNIFYIKQTNMTIYIVCFLAINV